MTPNGYTPGIAEARRGDRHVSAPAIKDCADCGKPKVDLGKRSTFGVGLDGHLVCSRCWQKGMKKLDAEEAGR